MNFIQSPNKLANGVANKLPANTTMRQFTTTPKFYKIISFIKSHFKLQYQEIFLPQNLKTKSLHDLNPTKLMNAATVVTGQFDLLVMI